MSSQVLKALGSCTRAAIAAPPGRSLGVCDLSSIEVWVLGWLTRCEGINEMARQGRDPYKAFGEIWLDIPYDECDKATRTLCKPPMLGSGYRLSAGEQTGPETFTGLMNYGRSMGIELTQEQALHATQVYREKFFEVVQWWYWSENTVCEVLINGRTVEGFGITFRKERDFMTILLPGSRKLWYHLPKWELVTTPWGAQKFSFTYMGKDQFTQQWQRISNHGGRFVEQITQAIARDILVHGMRMFERCSPDTSFIVGHLHDEGIAETPEDEAEERLALMAKCLTVTPPETPGLILGAEGYIAKRFRKG